jgi:hypothetical protein
MRLPLVGGSYTTRSIIASAQRCINYYPEINPRGSLVPLTHYQRPGLVPMVTVGNGPIRCIYPATNGDAYVVSGPNVYRLPAGTLSPTYVGSMNAARQGQVSMIDNGGYLMAVDGSTQGWMAQLGTNQWNLISDPTGLFTGADRVDFIDTFIIWNMPGTINFGSTTSNTIEPFNPLYFAGKTDFPDNLMTLYVVRHEIVLLGTWKSEVWYDAGLYPLPFAELPGTYIEHGIVAKYSVAQQDISLYWLGQNLQGSGMVFRFRGYLTDRISNHALEYAIAEMRKTSRIDDAIGFTYQMDGHVFYVLTFPSGDQTWVYDAAVDDPHMAWHQEAWTDTDGNLHRIRSNCHGLINGVNAFGDWQNGTIYQPDIDTYTDTVNGTATPLTCVRTFPHIGQARMAGSQQLVETDGKRLQFSGFRADFECGLGPVGIDGLPAQISLRWSDDRGRTFGNAILQSSGFPGEYLTQPQWLGMGIARDRVFELSHSIAGPAALNGAWIDAEVLGT